MPPTPWVRPPWCRHSRRDFKSFHICLDIAEDEAPAPLPPVKKPMSEEQKERIAESQRARWARVKAS